MSWWRTPDHRDFIIGANEGGGADRCVMYPRPTNLGNDLNAYIVEVTGNKFGKPFTLTLDINKPENCQAAKTSNAAADISEHSIYEKNACADAAASDDRGTRLADPDRSEISLQMFA
jgi:hypothetical protein